MTMFRCSAPTPFSGSAIANGLSLGVGYNFVEIDAEADLGRSDLSASLTFEGLMVFPKLRR
jgi:hypothetical protein